MKWLWKFLGFVGSEKKILPPPVVEYNEETIACRFADGTIQQMPWDKLRAVVIETNDSGPWDEDIYFILFSDLKEHFCAIPNCAKGTSDLLKRLQQLPGFDNEAIIVSMSCTSNKSFLCWEKKGWMGENWPGIVKARIYKDK